MRRWQVALVVLCFLALGVSIAERVRLLWLKAQPAAFRLPADREPTEDERSLWQRSLSDQVRAMGSARANADVALLVGVGPLVAGLIWALHQRRAGRCTASAE
jgi:hypothetical protein